MLGFVPRMVACCTVAGVLITPAYAAPAKVRLTAAAKAISFDGEEFDYLLSWKGKLAKGVDPDTTIAIQIADAADPEELILDEDSAEASGGSLDFSAEPKTKYRIKFFDDDGKLLKSLLLTTKKAPKVASTPTPKATPTPSTKTAKPNPTATATPTPTATSSVNNTTLVPWMPVNNLGNNPGLLAPFSIDGNAVGGYQYGGTVPNSTCAKHAAAGTQDWVGELKYKDGSNCYLHDSYGDHQITCNPKYPALPSGIIPGPYNATFDFVGSESKCYHHHANDVCMEIACGPPYQQIGLAENLGPVVTNAPLADPYRVPISVCAKHGVAGEQDWVAIFSYTNPFDQKCYTHDWNGEHQIACNPSKPFPKVSYGNVPGPYHATFDFVAANATCIHRHADDVCIVIACGPAYQTIGVGG